MKYQPVIGFEIHTELKTNSKMFCSCEVAFGGEPNSRVCPVCIGMPGTLPVPNKTAIDFTIRTSLALNCHINEHTEFDRKNYYYPDLPKAYQLSQDYNILGVNGSMDYEMADGTVKTVRINNVHIEEDAGKLVHPEESFADYSLVDLNRAGTPLIEIVTEPDLRTADEAEAFMHAMKSLLKYIDVSDCKMEEGSLRFEVNISLMEKGSDQFGTKVEIKNLNSISVALKVIEHEIKRQSKLLSKGESIDQETRLWNEAMSRTETMRSKEEAKDYRYFPDPGHGSNANHTGMDRRGPQSHSMSFVRKKLNAFKKNINYLNMIPRSLPLKKRWQITSNSPLRSVKIPNLSVTGL